VRLLGDGPGNLGRAPQVALVAPARDGASASYDVVAVRPGRRGEARVTLAGIGSREAAAALAGRLVETERRHLAPLADGEFYCFELVGCTVAATDGRLVGTLRAHWDTGGHGVLVVEGSEGEELLLPAAEALLREVDLARRRIVIEVPEGLLPA
jgi:16S rRNA processing protein RimM